MTGLEIFGAAVPAIAEAATTGDPQLSVIVRQAMRELRHWDLPIGVKHGDVLIGAIDKKLEGINRWMSDWRLRSSLRKSWGSQFRNVYCRAVRVASWEGCKQLGRAPECRIKMAVQVVRFVPAVNQFIRDDDGLAGSPKQLYDAMKDVGLIREDRREWLSMHPVVQDVSPIPGRAVTVFLLWPAPVVGLLTGASHVEPTQRPDARRQVPTDDRRTEEGGTVSRVRRRAGPRATLV
jgi:hypothetical protein